MRSVKLFFLATLLIIAHQSSEDKKVSLSEGQFILFKEKPSKALNLFLKNNFGIKKFSSLSSNYLDRLYYLEEGMVIANIGNRIEKVLDNQKMEVTLSSIKPSTNLDFSANDDLSGYQYGHYFSNQKFYFEKRDDLIQEKEISNNISINAKPLRQKIDTQFKRDIVVAVLDTGVDISHPDINFYVGEDCLQNGGIPIVDPQDNDGNGKAGDCRGWDFTKKRGRLNMPEDDARNGHGTHISGIISAKRGNDGLAGLSNRIKVLPIKVIKRNENLIGSAVSFTDQISKGIEYAIEKNVDVINMSYGWASTVDSEVIREHIRLANEKGIFVISAAGNDGNNLDFYPCNHKGVICVGSNSPLEQHKGKQEISDFSNYGGIVDLFAPGEAILSTFPRYLDSIDKVFDEEGYDYGYGTSQSTPFVSLSIAVLLGLETEKHLSQSPVPENHLKSIYARLINNSKELIDEKKWGFGGLVDLTKSHQNTDDRLISPEFKTIPVIKVNDHNEFTINLPIQNFGTDESNINMQIIHSNEIEIFSSTETIPAMKAFEQKMIQINGQFIGEDKSFHQIIEFNITSDSGFAKNYKKEFIFGTQSNSANSKTITINNQNETPYMLVKRRGIYVDRLKVVQDRHEDSQNTNFYYTKFDRQEDKAYISLLKLKSERTETFDYELPKNVNQAFFHFQRVDLNYDGKKDYILGVLIAFSDEEKAQGKKDYIEFHYLNSELKPLYQNHVISFLPKVSAITGLRNINFIQQKLKNGELIAVPIYIFNGGIDDDFLNSLDWVKKKPWLKKKEPFQKTRLYYSHLNEDKMILEEKIITTYHFDEKIRKQFNVRYFENITPLALGEQNKDAYYRGENKVYFSAGYSQQQRTFEVIFQNAKQTFIKPVNFGSGNIATSMLTRELGVVNQANNYFNTFLSNGNVEFFDPQIEDVHLFQFAGSEFRGIKAAYQDSGDLNLLFEFRDHFRLYSRKNGRFDQEYKQFPLGRVSFINGMVFKELSKSFTIHAPNNTRAALFIDSSAITRGHVYTVEMENNEIKSTLRNNVYLDYGCTALSPGNLDNRTYLISICEKDAKRDDASSTNKINGEVYFRLNLIK